MTGGQTQEKPLTFGEDTPMGRPASRPCWRHYVALADPAFSDTTGQIFGAVGGR